jgi:hypothetical protein
MCKENEFTGGMVLGEFQKPEIWEKEEEKGLSIGKLKYVYLQLAKIKFQGKVFINKHTGKHIRVSKDGIMEWWKKSRKREHIISVQLLDYYLENGRFTGEKQDCQKRKKIESASYFEIECKINDKLYLVTVTTRKAVHDINKFRYYTLKDMDILTK